MAQMNTPQQPRNGRGVSTDTDYAVASAYLLATGDALLKPTDASGFSASLVAAYTAGQMLRDAPDATTDACDIDRAEDALTHAERKLAQARDRADYHNWNGSSSRGYTEAEREVRQARRRLRDARRRRAVDRARNASMSIGDGESADDGSGEGRGAFAWALLAFLIAGATFAAVALYLLAHFPR